MFKKLKIWIIEGQIIEVPLYSSKYTLLTCTMSLSATLVPCCNLRSSASRISMATGTKIEVQILLLMLMNSMCTQNNKNACLTHDLHVHPNTCIILCLMTLTMKSAKTACKEQPLLQFPLGCCSSQG